MKAEITMITPEFIVHFILIAALVIFAIIAIEHKNLVYSVISLMVMSVFLGIIYFLLSAPYVAVFQLVIYAGAVTVLFLATISLVSKAKGEGEE
ncbi:MAG: NADH-quinone oxidoreductase subunit J family protein [Candidatus Odinarchaeia archaeon]